MAADTWASVPIFIRTHAARMWRLLCHVAKGWIGRSACEQTLSADLLTRLPACLICRQCVDVSKVVPAHKENRIRERLIQFNLKTKVHRKTNHWSSQEQREEFYLEQESACFIKCLKSHFKKILSVCTVWWEWSPGTYVRVPLFVFSSYTLTGYNVKSIRLRR